MLANSVAPSDVPAPSCTASTLAQVHDLSLTDVGHAGHAEDGGESMTLSARNHLKGTIGEIQCGDVLAHITVRVGDSVIESVITKRSAEEMALKKGDAVTAVVKATEVMIAKP